MAFVGDHPAQSFERGSQVGGHYKCGGCNCRIDEIAHAFTCTWRSLQSLVLKGKFGKEPGVLKPFSGLTRDQLSEELRSTGVFDLTGNNFINSILCGIQ